MSTQFTFRGKGVEHWRSRFGMSDNFEGLVRRAQEELGFSSKGKAILFSRRIRPDLWNEFQRKQNPVINGLSAPKSGPREVQHFAGMPTNRFGKPFAKRIGG